MPFQDDWLRNDLSATDPTGQQTAVHAGQRFRIRDWSRYGDWVEFTVEDPPGVVFKSSLRALEHAGTDWEHREREAKAESERLRARAQNQLERSVETLLMDGWILLSRTESGARLFKRGPKFVGTEPRIPIPGTSETVVWTLEIDDQAGDVRVLKTKA